ncbi:MAG: hypothetical protein AAGD92_10285 [Pseudomonadota bacterium]
MMEKAWPLVPLIFTVLLGCGREGPPEPDVLPLTGQGNPAPPSSSEEEAPETKVPALLPSQSGAKSERLARLSALPDIWEMGPGNLLPGSNTVHGSTGVTDPSVIAPEMIFPFAEGPAFANSQILNPGGGGYWGGEWPAPGGAENSAVNFSYPWRDNFCEARKEVKHETALCPGGRAHKGQDLRPKTCDNAVHWLVAPEDGWVTHVGSISVYLLGKDSNLRYRFLHVQKPLPDWVKTGAIVTQGHPFARVSDLLAVDNRATTVHTHLEIHGAAEVNGFIYDGALPPYTSLVEAFKDYADANPGNVAPVAPPHITRCARPQWP